MKKHLWKKLLLFAVCAGVLWLLYPGLYKESDAKTDLSMDEFEDIIGTYNIDDSILDYNSYLTQYAQVARPDKKVVADYEDCVRYEEDGMAVEPTVYENYEGRSGKSLLTKENSLVEYEITVPETGLYNLSVLYYSVEGKNSDIERSIFIDGTLPF